MISSHRLDGFRFESSAAFLLCSGLRGSGLWARILGLWLIIGVLALVGCQTPQMRDLHRMGVFPEDISDRIAKEGETPVGYSQHVPPAEEKAPAPKPTIGILNRGKEPEAQPTVQAAPAVSMEDPPAGLPASSPPPFPTDSKPYAPPFPQETKSGPSPSAPLEVFTAPKRIEVAAQTKKEREEPAVADAPIGTEVVQPKSTKQEKAGIMRKQSIFDVPTLKERATQLGRKYSGSRVVATVNGRAILEEEVNWSLITSPAGDEITDKERRKKILDVLIDREVAIWDVETKLGKSAQGKQMLGKIFEMGTKEYETLLRNIKDKNKMETVDEVKAMFKSQGVQLELMKRQTERNRVAMIYLSETARPKTDRIGHRDLKEYYEQNPDLFKISESIQWRDIFIAKSKFNTPEEARQQADMVAQKVREGEDFVKLSKTYCHGDSALRDGQGAGSKPGEIRPPEAEPVLDKLQDGQLAPVLELRTGFHIIQLVKRQRGGKRPFDESVQKEIRDRLKNDTMMLEINRTLLELKRNAVIEIMPEI